MLCVETIGKIRRRRLVQGESISAIARDLQLSRKGYTGAVDAGRRHQRQFERRRHSSATAFIPQTFASGEAYQFDFSHEHVEIGGIDQVVKVAHVRLSPNHPLT